MGHYELITACFFFLKISSKKGTFLKVHTPKFADPPPPIVHTCCEVLLLFFGGFPVNLCCVSTT